MPSRLKEHAEGTGQQEIVLTPPDTEAVRGCTVYWSYSSTPTGGRLCVSSDLDTYIDLDIVAGGPGFIPLDRFPFEVGEELTVVLTSGGGSVVGKVSVHGQST
jgi:hypothetical protein